MEAARLGFQDFHQLGNMAGNGLLSRGGPPPLGLGLPFLPGCEPWAAAAAAAVALSGPTAVPSLSTLSSSLPGFLSHPQVIN